MHHTRDVKKNCGSCCFYVRCMTSVVREGVMPWPINRENLLHLQLGILDKGHAIKVLVVFNLMGCK